jgi:ParB family transcriptional regulator, chromosome partitioning protein
MASWPIPIHQITVGERFRKDIGDLDALAESMRYHGCVLSPILIDGAYQVINGERRLRAAQRLGWSHIEAQIIDLADPLSAELDENEQRKPFTVSERVAIARALEARFPERRGQRASPAAEHEGPDAGDKIAQLRNLPAAIPPPGTHKRDWIARRAGFDSGDSFHRAAQAVESGIPALVEALDRGEVSIAAAADVATLPAAEQAPVVAAGPKAIQAKAGEVRRFVPVPVLSPMVRPPWPGRRRSMGCSWMIRRRSPSSDGGG